MHGHPAGGTRALPSAGCLHPCTHTHSAGRCNMLPSFHAVADAGQPGFAMGRVAAAPSALVPCCGRCWPAWLCDGARCSCARPRPLLDAHVHGGGSARRTRSRVPCCGCAGSAAASCDQRMRTATPSAQLATARRAWLRAGKSTSPRSTRAHPVRSHAHTPLSHPHPTHCTQSCTHFHH